MPGPLLCTRCGSDSVIPRVRVVERGDDGLRHDLQVEVQELEEKLVFVEQILERDNPKPALPKGR